MIDSNQDVTKAVVLPAFSGKKKDFGVWWPRFISYAAMKGFAAAFEETFVLPADPNALTGTDEEKKEQKKKITQNAVAVASLTMAFTTAEDMEFVDMSASPQYPQGHANAVVKTLKKKYRPQDRIATVEAEAELMKLKMKGNKNPDEYFRKLAVIKNKYKDSKSFDESTLIAMTIAKAPEKYSTVLASELRNKGDQVTLEDLKETLQQLHRIQVNTTKGDESDEEEKDGEAALNASANIICYNCGKSGHFARNCPEKEKGKQKWNKNKKFRGKCNNCGRRGHKAKDCWEKAENAHKRPANWKSTKKESANTGIEACLACIDSKEITVPEIKDFTDGYQYINNSDVDDEFVIVEDSEKENETNREYYNLHYDEDEVELVYDDEDYDDDDDENEIVINDDDDDDSGNQEQEAALMNVDNDDKRKSDDNGKLGICADCKRVGVVSMECDTCNTPNKNFVPMNDVIDESLMTDVERRVGTCPNCHGFGILYETCWKCGTMHYDFPLVDENGIEINDGDDINDIPKPSEVMDVEIFDENRTVCNDEYTSTQCSIATVPLGEALKVQRANRVKSIGDSYDQVQIRNKIRRHYTNKCIVAKHVLSLTGRIWGGWINSDPDPGIFGTTGNNMMYDIARCHECNDYGLWGDLCKNCPSSMNTYLEILAECLICKHRGPLGNSCEYCCNYKNKQAWYKKIVKALHPRHARGDEKVYEIEKAKFEDIPTYARNEGRVSQPKNLIMRESIKDYLVNKVYNNPIIVPGEDSEDELIVASAVRPRSRRFPSDASDNAVGQRLLDMSHEAYVEEQKANDDRELAGYAGDMSMDDLKDEVYWIGDTGATTHLTNNRQAMNNIKSAQNYTVVMGNGTESKGKVAGDISGYIYNNKDEKVMSAVIHDVVYSKTTKFNLFSITSMINKGWKLHGDEKALTLTKRKTRIAFDIKVKTPKGFLFVMKFKRNKSEEVAAPVQDKEEKISIQRAHQLLSYRNEVDVRQTCKHLGIMVKDGKLRPSDAVYVGKAKKNVIPKVSEGEKSKVVNGRVNLDLATLKWKVNGVKAKITNPVWRLVVDERSTLKFTSFHATKDDMVEPTCEQFHAWKYIGKPVQIVRCDNAGENKLLEQRLKGEVWKMPVKFEYTGRATPQQNSLVERGFDTLMSDARSMMYKANIPEDKRHKLCKEAIMTATLNDGLMVKTIDGRTATRFEHFGDEIPRFARNLRIWGEAGVVSLRDLKTPKIGDKGLVCMFVGYALQHPSDCYRMYNCKTGRIHVTRDVKWLHKMFFNEDKEPNNDVVADMNNDTDENVIDDFDEIEENEKEATVEINVAENEIEVPEVDENPTDGVEEGNEEKTTESDSDESVSDESQNSTSEKEISWANSNEDKGEWTKVKTRSGRKIYKPKRQLYETGNTAFTKAEINYYSVLADADDFDESEETRSTNSDIQKEIAAVGAGVGGGFNNTQELHVMKYKEAMNSDKKKEWLDAIDEEYKKFEKFKVFEPIKIEDVPKNAKILTNTWACKMKSNGTYRARLNMRGYEQKDGEHYNSASISSPVTNDVTIRIIFVLLLMAGYMSYLLDIRGAFLHGEFHNGEIIYSRIPEGFQNRWDPKIWLWKILKTIYGMKQSGMSFWIQLLKCMRHMGFSRSNSDPALYYKWTEKGLNVWISWVDDLLTIGPKEDVIKNKEELMKRFECDDIGKLNEYVGCKIDINEEERCMKITQPVLLQSYEDEFDLMNKEFKTPAEAKQVLVKASDDSKLGPDEQFKFRSGIGKLLHMMRWSRPEIWNSVRECSRHLGNCSRGHTKAMKRIMKYCTLTPKRGWRLKPKRSWNGKDKTFLFIILGRPDASYGSCIDTRRSTTGIVVFLEGTPVVVKSGLQKIVALSTAEAELIAMVQCIQEMIFVKKVLESMELKVQLPMIVQCDNKGAVDMANGWNVNGGTKHIDICLNFIRELKEEGTIRVEWISTNDMTADILSKNLDKSKFEKFTEELCGTDEYKN